MKMKLREIMALHQAISSISSLPYEIARPIAETKRNLAPFVEAYNSAELALIEEYGIKDESGKFIQNGTQVALRDIPAFNLKQAKLADKEEEVELKKFPSGTLPNREMSPNLLAEILALEESGT